MKKLFASFFIFVFTLTLALCLVGCAKQCTYTFVDEDGTVLSEGTGKKGSTIVAPTNPTKASTDEFSYEFIGWDKEVGKLESDITFIAQYKEVKRKYTVKFLNYDESVLKEESVEYGLLPTAPATPTKADTDEFSYEFVGWDKEVVAVTGDVVYTAQYREVKRQYTYKFVNFDGKVLKSETVDYGTLPTAPANPSRTATKEFTYSFSGWDKELPTNMPAYDIDVYGTYNKNTYYINYYIDNVLYKTISYLYDNSIKVLEVTSKTGYTFSGWDKVLPTNMPAQDIDVYGTYNINTYQINYYIDNELYKTVNYKYNELINNLDVPEKSGYTFSGWDKELPTNMPAENLNFYGSYVIATYQITYVYEEGNLPTHTLNTLEELSQVFWDEFYAWSGSTKSLEEFKTEHLTSWKTGNHGTSK